MIVIEQRSELLIALDVSRFNFKPALMTLRRMMPGVSKVSSSAGSELGIVLNGFVKRLYNSRQNLTLTHHPVSNGGSFLLKIMWPKRGTLQHDSAL